MYVELEEICKLIWIGDRRRLWIRYLFLTRKVFAMRCNTAWTSRTRADRSNTKCQSVGCQALSVSRQEEIWNLSYKTIYIESTLRDTGWWPLFHRRTRYESHEILSSPCERNRRSKITSRKEQTSRDTLLRETDKITFRVYYLKFVFVAFDSRSVHGQARKGNRYPVM